MINRAGSVRGDEGRRKKDFGIEHGTLVPSALNEDGRTNHRQHAGKKVAPTIERLSAKRKSEVHRGRLRA